MHNDLPSIFRTFVVCQENSHTDRRKHNTRDLWRHSARSNPAICLGIFASSMSFCQLNSGPPNPKRYQVKNCVQRLQLLKRTIPTMATKFWRFFFTFNKWTHQRPAKTSFRFGDTEEGAATISTVTVIFAFLERKNPLAQSCHRNGPKSLVDNKGIPWMINGHFLAVTLNC